MKTLPSPRGAQQELEGLSKDRPPTMTPSSNHGSSWARMWGQGSGPGSSVPFSLGPGESPSDP